MQYNFFLIRKVRVRCWIWHKTIEQSVNMSNRSASVWYERRMEFWIGVLLNLDAILFGWMSGECNTSHHLSLHIDVLVTRFCLLDCRYFRQTGKEGRKNFVFVFSHAITLISRRRYTTAECWSIRDFPLTQKAKISEVRSEVRHVKCTGMGGRFLGDMIDSGGAGRLAVRNGMKTSCPFTKTKRNWVVRTQLRIVVVLAFVRNPSSRLQCLEAGLLRTTNWVD